MSFIPLYNCNNIPVVPDDNVYKYDNQNDKLYEGWPKKIRDVFKGKTSDDVIPDNLDTVFFDLRDKNLYFFKNDMVSSRQ